MSIQIQLMPEHNSRIWDDYAYGHEGASIYHLSNWKGIIEKSYRHKSFYLMALNNSNHDTQKVCGILPLIQIKSKIFGNSICSLPFFDMGGVVADNRDIEHALLRKAIILSRSCGADLCELRQESPISTETQQRILSEVKNHEIGIAVNKNKVRMTLDLPGSASKLMNGFKSKLRSQIRRPAKAGLYAKIGGSELFNDFYNVFSINMRDLGSPVHSRRMIKSVLEVFPGEAKIVTVYYKEKPVAAGIIVGFKKVISNPWASALKQYRNLSPNMLLYWTMLSYACENGYSTFDFGRSTPGEGTFNFKAQWGAKEQLLNWFVIQNKNSQNAITSPEKAKFRTFINLWKKMPVSVSVMIGPRLRKNIRL